MNGVEKTVSEWAVCLIKMVLGVEGIEAVPAKLILALRALHELATTCSYYTYLARWTRL